MGFAATLDMGGLAPLPWTEIESFARATGRISTPWEFETVRAMSEAYIAGSVEGRELLSIMPVDRD